MKISIITVCYNSEKTIEKTFMSIQSQTYADIEYIVVDGNSKDGTVSIIEKYSHLIDKWISEKDQGLYDAMNKGVAMATGDIVGILNSDDVFHSNDVIEKIATFHKNNPVEASVGNIVQFNQNGKIVRKYSAKNWSPNRLRIGFMPPHPGLFIKRSLFEKWGDYQIDFKIGADYELITRYFLKNNISWKYSGITTTAMLVGGVSSSGVSSYHTVTEEICKALKRNEIEHAPLKIKLRGLWKFIGLLKR